jgi:hypothetical protein
VRLRHGRCDGYAQLRLHESGHAGLCSTEIDPGWKTVSFRSLSKVFERIRAEMCGSVPEAEEGAKKQTEELPALPGLPDAQS